MGDKATARETMKKAGVPTVPGSEGLIQASCLPDKELCLLLNILLVCQTLVICRILCVSFVLTQQFADTTVN